jgi:hypothetical protein
VLVDLPILRLATANPLVTKASVATVILVFVDISSCSSIHDLQMSWCESRCAVRGFFLVPDPRARSQLSGPAVSTNLSTVSTALLELPAGVLEAGSTATFMFRVQKASDPAAFSTLTATVVVSPMAISATIKGGALCSPCRRSWLTRGGGRRHRARRLAGRLAPAGRVCDERL